MHANDLSIQPVTAILTVPVRAGVESQLFVPLMFVRLSTRMLQFTANNPL